MMTSRRLATLLLLLVATGIAIYAAILLTLPILFPVIVSLGFE